ncbi:MAG: LapA family protein [Sphingomicrobium sp.]
MQFLKTLFWAFLAIVIALFASRNWVPVTLSLWGDIQADIKIPVLLGAIFLLGFLPTWIVMRAKVWALRRRLEALERNLAPPPPIAAASAPALDDEPAFDTEGMHA